MMILCHESKTKWAAEASKEKAHVSYDNDDSTTTAFSGTSFYLSKRAAARGLDIPGVGGYGR